MRKEIQTPHIPYDIYESPQEIVIIMPLWWVQKTSIELKIDNYRLVINGKREQFKLKDNCVPLKEECYRWDIKEIIDLPSQVYFENIHSKLNKSNVLKIIVPKAIVPEKIAVEVEYDSE